jgi:hypothetical protein
LISLCGSNLCMEGAVRRDDQISALVLIE